MRLSLPQITEKTIQFAKSLNCNWIGIVPIQTKPFCKLWNCHNNVLEYVDWYGGTRKIGFYILEDFEKYWAIQHSIVETFDRKLIDITPSIDGRGYNIFCVTTNQMPDYNQPIVTWYKKTRTICDISQNYFN